jgi:hypothetical protein
LFTIEQGTDAGLEIENARRAPRRIARVFLLKWLTDRLPTRRFATASGPLTPEVTLMNGI